MFVIIHTVGTKNISRIFWQVQSNIAHTGFVFLATPSMTCCTTGKMIITYINIANHAFSDFYTTTFWILFGTCHTNSSNFTYKGV